MNAHLSRKAYNEQILNKDIKSDLDKEIINKGDLLKVVQAVQKNNLVLFSISLIKNYLCTIKQINSEILEKFGSDIKILF